MYVIIRVQERNELLFISDVWACRLTLLFVCAKSIAYFSTTSRSSIPLLQSTSNAVSKRTGKQAKTLRLLRSSAQERVAQRRNICAVAMSAYEYPDVYMDAGIAPGSSSVSTDAAHNKELFQTSDAESV